mgnify:CR=1 FL=1
MKLQDLASSIVVYVGQDASVTEAARLMRARHTGCVVVVADAGRGPVDPVGILTDRDLVVEVLAQEVDLRSIAVKDVMTTNPVVATVDDGLFETLNRMRAQGIRRVPVIGADGQVVGLFSTDDALSVFASALSDIDALIVAEQRHERSARAGA